MPRADDQNTQASNLTYIRDSMHEAMLERDEEHALALRWKNQRDVKAMQKIINAYRRLVVAQASKFKHYGLPLADLIQEGNIGILEAINRFEPDRDVRFSTYASWWIKASLQDYVLRNWSIVRTGTTSAHKSLFFNMRRIKAKIENIEGSTLPASKLREKVADTLGINVSDVEKMEMRMHGGDQSLNIQVGEDGDTELQALMPSSEPNPEDVVMSQKDAQARSAWLDDALSKLSVRDRNIIEQRHLSHEPVTLETMGQRLGISKERVRQLESRAMDHLKAALSQRVSNASDFFTDY